MENSILFIQEFGSAVPSGKIRGLIYEMELNKLDISVKYINRNNEVLILKIGSVNSILLRFFLSLINYVNRFYNSINILFISRSYSAIWLNKVLSYRFIYLLRLFNPGKIINLDVVDNPYEANENWSKAIKYVSSLSTDNNYNKNKLSKFSDKIFIIPDFPLIDKFDVCNEIKSENEFIFGWVGSKSSYYLLKDIELEISDFLNNNSGVKFYLLGAPRNSIFSNMPGVVFLENYDESKMIEIISRLHVGLFPLDNSIASEVRGVLKATLYMAGGAVVLSNPIGEVNDLILNDVDGVLITRKGMWFDKLVEFKGDTEKLKYISQNGYIKVNSNYSLSSNISKIIEILKL